MIQISDAGCTGVRTHTEHKAMTQTVVRIKFNAQAENKVAKLFGDLINWLQLKLG